jgi:diguanylate cyclase (GGDEF)-like protein/PAS domain S-box-containing protein
MQNAPAATASAPPAGRMWLGVLALALFAFLGSWFALSLARFGGVAAVWVANGLLTGALLLSPKSTWRWWLLAGALGQIAARVLVGDAAPLVLGLTLANLLECGIIAWWVRREVADLRLAPSLRRVARDAFLSTLAACAISATVALPIVLWGGAASAALAWGTWFSAHLLGMVIVATLTVCGFQRGVNLVGAPGRRLDFALCLGLLLLVCALAFGQARYSLLFLVFLALLLLSWRHGLGGMVLGILAVAAISGVTAVQGRGSFALAQDAAPLARLFYWQVYLAAGCLLAYSTAIAITQREQLERQLQRSEGRFRLLAEHSHDLIVRRLVDGRRAYVSPSSLAILGYEPDALPSLEELVHPEDRERVLRTFAKLYSGEASDAQVGYRVRHRDGHFVWLEANARRVVADDGPQVVYTARDVSERVRAQQSQLAAQAQMKAITDHLPAMVARFDRHVRYVYANARSRAMVPGVDLIGKSLLELRGEQRYQELLPYIEGALRGEPQQFDTWLDTPRGRVELRAQFVPDIGGDGSVQGFYSVSFDISEAKRLERELEQQARFDPLTGLANRLNFDEALARAVARAQRTSSPLMLLALDLDRFKQINDTLGHAAGDEVLKEFGRRVKASVYDVDLVARLGGDEFVVLVEYSATQDSGERIANAIVEAMRPPVDLPGGATVQAATSIGVGLQQPVHSPEALLALADKALYEAKGRGRNTFALLRE